MEHANTHNLNTYWMSNASIVLVMGTALTGSDWEERSEADWFWSGKRICSRSGKVGHVRFHCQKKDLNWSTPWEQQPSNRDRLDSDTMLSAGLNDKGRHSILCCSTGQTDKACPFVWLSTALFGCLLLWWFSILTKFVRATWHSNTARCWPESMITWPTCGAWVWSCILPLLEA